MCGRYITCGLWLVSMIDLDDMHHHHLVYTFPPHILNCPAGCSCGPRPSSTHLHPSSTPPSTPKLYNLDSLPLPPFPSWPGSQSSSEKLITGGAENHSFPRALRVWNGWPARWESTAFWFAYCATLGTRCGRKWTWEKMSVSRSIMRKMEMLGRGKARGVPLQTLPTCSYPPY